jgi:ribosome-associated protein
MEREFKLTQEYIELYKLLKTTNIAATGGHGKLLIDDGLVMLNGEVELRKRAKVRKGDQVEFEEILIRII